MWRRRRRGIDWGRLLSCTLTRHHPVSVGDPPILVVRPLCPRGLQVWVRTSTSSTLLAQLRSAVTYSDFRYASAYYICGPHLGFRSTIINHGYYLSASTQTVQLFTLQT